MLVLVQHLQLLLIVYVLFLLLLLSYVVLIEHVLAQTVERHVLHQSTMKERERQNANLREKGKGRETELERENKIEIERDIMYTCVASFLLVLDVSSNIYLFIRMKRRGTPGTLRAIFLTSSFSAPTQ